MKNNLNSFSSTVNSEEFSFHSNWGLRTDENVQLFIQLFQDNESEVVVCLIDVILCCNEQFNGEFLKLN